MKHIYEELNVDEPVIVDGPVFSGSDAQNQVGIRAAEERQREDPWEGAPLSSQYEETVRQQRNPDAPWDSWDKVKKDQEIASPWEQDANPHMAGIPGSSSPQRNRSSRHSNDAESETVTPEDDDDNAWGKSWTGKEEKDQQEDEADSAPRTGDSRRPRRTAKIPGERRRGKPQVATYKAGIQMAIALVSGNMAEGHSFVQVCDQGEMQSAYMTILILMCLLFAACAYIYKLHCLMKISSKEISTVQTDIIRPVVSHCKGAAPAAKRMSVVHSAHLPTWCKDIYLCSTLQLEKNSGGPYTCSTVRTKSKYHVQQDCPALRNSQVLQVSLCKLCENKHK